MLLSKWQKLDSKSTFEQVQATIGVRPFQDDDSARAVLDGKPITRRIVVWNMKWEASLKADPMDSVVTAVFGNGLLMNLKVGGVAIPRSEMYFSKMACEPDCSRLKEVGRR